MLHFKEQMAENTKLNYNVVCFFPLISLFVVVETSVHSCDHATRPLNISEGAFSPLFMKSRSLTHTHKHFSFPSKNLDHAEQNPFHNLQPITAKNKFSNLYLQVYYVNYQMIT